MKTVYLSLLFVIGCLILPWTSANELNLIKKKCSCGRNETLKSRIIGGSLAGSSEFPWHSVIFEGKQNICGGSVINDRYILSAAHCFIFLNPMSKAKDQRDFNAITIVVGETYLDSPTAKRIRMSELFVHTSYNPKTFYADIAICKLEVPIKKFMLNRILPICLPPKGISFIGTVGTVTGFGDTNPRMEIKLHKTTVKVLTQKTCKNNLGKKMAYNCNTMMCAASPGRDSCNGDSGGPLVAELERKKLFQIGIVSYGIGCGNYKYPGVYTKVSKFRDWIMFITKDGIFCEK